MRSLVTIALVLVMGGGGTSVPSDDVSERLRIIVGDCRDELRRLPRASVQCVVTSPPYWQQRDYGLGPEQLGLEATPSEFVRRIKKCVGFSTRGGAGRIEVVNEFAFRATDPADLAWRFGTGRDIVGPLNDDAIAKAMRACFERRGRLILAWGAPATKGRVQPYTMRRLRELQAQRRKHIYAAALAHHLEPLCLGTTRDGHPRHPLMVGYATQLEPWRPR